MDISTIADPIIRIFNLISGAAGLIFVIMIFFSAYKYSLAQGDPKALSEAKETLTQAVYGFIVAIGAFAIVTIMGNILGLDMGIFDNPGESSKGAIQDLQEFLNSGSSGGSGTETNVSPNDPRHGKPGGI